MIIAACGLNRASVKKMFPDICKDNFVECFQTIEELNHSLESGNSYDVVLSDPSLYQKKKETKQNSRNENRIIVRRKGMIHSIDVTLLTYVESRGHQIIIHMIEGEDVVCYDKLENLKEKLPSYIVQCHKSYLVSFRYVSKIERNHMILKTGQELPISKARSAEAKREYCVYAEEA